MSLVAPVKDGVVQDSGVVSRNEEAAKGSGSGLGKDAFLQLLVAQMKYQDPLEPTSNTEYISQLATFSSLEEMQNMTSSLNLQRASGLVGQQVYIEATDPSTGKSSQEYGVVDYVAYENGKAYVMVNGNKYSVDDVKSVYDKEYTTASDLAYNWTVGLNRLPALSKLTLADEKDIKALQETYDKMTDYQKTFLTKENIEKFEKYVEKMELLKKAAEELENAGGDKTEDTDKVEDTDKTEETDKAEGTDKTEDADKVEDTDKTEETETAGALD